jgi:hypothetical protein
VYHYKKRDIYLQGGVAIMLTSFGILLGDWAFLAIIGFVSFLLIKDCYKQLHTVIEVKGDRIEVRVGDRVDQTFLFKDFQFITRTKRHNKWVVVGYDKTIFYIRPSIDRYEQMLLEVLKYNRSNKKIFIHETIETMAKLI